MVVIRLSRGGAKARPFYSIAQDRLTYWTGVGATASDTVARLIKQQATKAA
mgnify:CR=1 FL=1